MYVLARIKNSHPVLGRTSCTFHATFKFFVRPAASNNNNSLSISVAPIKIKYFLPLPPSYLGQIKLEVSSNVTLLFVLVGFDFIVHSFEIRFVFFFCKATRVRVIIVEQYNLPAISFICRRQTGKLYTVFYEEVHMIL